MSDKVTLWKRCACQSTASGPRFITTLRGNTARMIFATMACDKCDTPYTRAKPKRKAKK